ncbi:hypothetical protein ACJX0J_025960 [Zea mays]
MKASSHIIREIHLDRMSISTTSFQTFSKNVNMQPHQKLHTIRYHHLYVVFSDNISDMLAVALYSFTSFFASIFNKAFSLLPDLMIYRPLFGRLYLCIKFVPAFHMILLIIDYIVDLNNNITIEILSICAPIDLYFLIFLEMAEAPFIRKKELTKEKHISMNKVRVKKGNLVLDMY